MRHLRTTALAALVLSATGGLPPAAPAQAAAADLYVDNGRSCSDTAPDAGTEQDPYCSAQAAADAAQPGQTVHLSATDFRTGLHLTRSGRAGAPITFLGTLIPSARHEGAQSRIGALTVDGAHDLVLRLIQVADGTADVTVTGSSRITLDRMTLNAYQAHTTPTVHLTGQSSDVTVSRSWISATGDAVLVDQGVQGAVVTTDNIDTWGAGAGVRVLDATGAAVTSNTVETACGPGIALGAAATGTTAENNVLIGRGDTSNPPQPCAPDRADLTVAAGAAGTKADYNAFHHTGDHAMYSWAGQPYADAAALHAATGQGGHDLAGLTDSTLTQPALIDSADQYAPGELDTDSWGHRRVDDPQVANTGTGGGYYDRGATEYGDPMSIHATPEQRFTGTDPYEVTFSGPFVSPWGPATASLDFGDGSDPVPFTGADLKHVYPKAGPYAVKLTVTDVAGTVTFPQTFQVQEPAPPKVTVDVTPWAPTGQTGPHQVWITEHLTNSWPVVNNTVDFGDGTKLPGDATREVTHAYAKPGDYPVTVTVTDGKGQVGTTTAHAIVGDGFVRLTPARVLDTRTGGGTPVGPGQSVKIDVAHAAGVKTTPSAVLLNLTATQPTAAGFVTAFPSGSPRPTVSSLNFTAGQTVANAAVVPVGPDGTITLYNHSGTTQLIADLNGYYTTAEPGARFAALDAQRVADTRGNWPTGKLGPGGTVTIPLRGGVGHDYVPEDATSVVLNLTATGATEPGYVSGQPGTSNLNFAAGQTVANQVTLPIAPDGTVTLFNHNGQVNLVADVQGSYGPTGSLYVPATPTRYLDTRTDRSTFHAGELRQYRIGGQAGVPAGAKAVLVNLTAVNPTAAGYLGAGDLIAGTSSALNFAKGQTVANLVWVRLLNDAFDLYNFTGDTDVVVDVQGYTM
ncbi:hypothetical protein CFP65_4766 [Kitasatospora sp. MMS16-BH015]|uniref:PKD domain-containing protein n=1 Tax=Kitasatospora sp. MMS16-BH015 TaxID=2018025 RepID=UPI000CA0D7B1|nr:PKD domain-containing protein [Kitasatospora sp. MMS16-BH015]AUG79488.1 hypothetical protein CFP65_4766 [Kitasatospora sp. MMS16-BH015]